MKFHDDRCKGKAVMRRKPKCVRTWRFQYTPPCNKDTLNNEFEISLVTHVYRNYYLRFIAFYCQLGNMPLIHQGLLQMPKAGGGGGGGFNVHYKCIYRRAAGMG